MAKPTGELIGLKEANAALRRLPEFAKVEAQQVFDVSSFQLSRRIQANIWVDTGFLQVRVDWESRPRSLSAVVGVNREAFYWKFHEFGTVKKDARPVFRPAADAVREDHDRRLLQALERAATKVERAQGPVI